MKVMVTGASGFVGRRLVDVLIRDGFEVTSIARRSPSTQAVRTLVVSEPWTTARLLPAFAGADALVHLAARAHVVKRPPPEHEALLEEINVGLTESVATAAFNAGVRRFVLVSSIGAVGNRSRPGQALSEATECHPETPYGRSKLKAEKILAALAGRSGTEFVIVRPPLVHGPGAPGNLERLGRLVATGLPLPFDGLDNRRSLIHVDELALLLSLSLSRTEARNQVFHVRDFRDYTTTDILRGIADSLGRRPRLFRFPMPALRFAAQCVGKAAALDQLTESLQVDDALVRRTFGVVPRDRQIEI